MQTCIQKKNQAKTNLKKHPKTTLTTFKG